MVKLVQFVIRINNRLYKRALERRGFYSNKKVNYKNNSYSTIIELDTISWDSKLGSILSPEERKRYIDNKLYFKCGKLGHIVNRCGKKKH